MIFDLTGSKFRADGCTFVIPRDVTSRGYRACFLGDSYEKDERELICRFLQPGDRVLEVGACLGIVSCITNRLLSNPRAHVVVEGNPMLIPAIHRNRQLNGCEFLVEPCAASGEKDVTFYLHPTYVVGGTTQRETALPCRVPGRSLMELENRYGPFTTLILDVEGSESELLPPAVDWLKRVRLVVLELHPWAIGEDGVEACREVLRQAGLTKVGSSGLTEAWMRAS